jgi:hypothetical protein
MITVKSLGKNRCIWCAQEKDGVDVEMQDGSLKGFLCRGDFWKLLKSRDGNGKVHHVVEGERSEQKAEAESREDISASR